jgi:adenylosuccinate lyase
MSIMDYSVYQSPFTWRYGSPEMRALWGEAEKRRLWRFIWVALAETQAELGLFDPARATDLRAHLNDVNVARALEIETEIHHDLMAELKTFAEQAPVGAGILHLGATSTDIEDNADALRLRRSLDWILTGLGGLLRGLAGQVETYADLPVMGFTHLQPAEPTTLGYRLAGYAQDLLMDWDTLRAARAGLRGKGFKGAVGTGAAYAELLGMEQLAEFERRMAEKLGLPFFPVTTQVYPRKQDYIVLSALAGLGGSLYRLAFDLRLLQSPPLGELAEPFGSKQVGSSAMPFKRNPINAEKIDSLARMLAQAPRVAWDNAAHSLLERTLDDSANRRTLLPESFLAADELLRTAGRILGGLRVDEIAIRRNLEIYGPFAAVERALMALVQAGADRQAMHERLRGLAMQAWAAVQEGRSNPLIRLVVDDPQLRAYLSEADLRTRMDASGHVGDAPARAKQIAAVVRDKLGGEV